MLSSTVKNLLISFSCLYFLSACGAPESGSLLASLAGSNTTTALPGAPKVEVQVQNGRFSLNWNDTNAEQYRVLFWHGNEAPGEHLTTDTVFTLPPLSRGDYTVIVEAYDALGNSVFSTPVSVEAV